MNSKLKSAHLSFLFLLDFWWFRIVFAVLYLFCGCIVYTISEVVAGYPAPPGLPIFIVVFWPVVSIQLLLYFVLRGLGSVEMVIHGIANFLKRLFQ